MQSSNALDGFTLITEFKKEDIPAPYELMPINEAVIPSGSAPNETYEKMDQGLATSEDKIIGVGVVHEQEIRQITIRYSYFGLPFKKTVTLKM